MRTIFAEYNPHRNSIDVYTSAGYMLRIDCWEAEKNLKTTPGSDCALTSLAVDEPLEYARLYLAKRSVCFAVFFVLHCIKLRRIFFKIIEEGDLTDIICFNAVKST